MFPNLTSARRALPSLNALRAFEAMARTGRATLAAEELAVTHSAVSRQVKALEESLGVRLFAGPKNRLELTEAGRQLLPALTEAFDGIAAATLRIRGAEGEDLHVAVNASVSVKWLIPRLAGFAEARPRIRLHLAELPSHATSHRGAHAVVRILGSSRLSEPGVTRFIDNHIGPVMAPRFGADPLRAPRLVAQTHLQGWAIWAALAGVELSPAPVRPFAHLHFAMDAALAGLGAAVLPWPLVAEDILAGRLVAPLGFRKAESAFALLRSPGALPQAVDQFADWLVAEGAKTPPAP
jgi:DNA-binding transcriptional LysR family regulator